MVLPCGRISPVYVSAKGRVSIHALWSQGHGEGTGIDHSEVRGPTCRLAGVNWTFPRRYGP